MEPLQPLNPGDRFQPSASWYNATIEVIKEYFKGRQREQAEGPDFRVVQIQNKSGLALHNCSIVGIGEILVDPADSTRFKSSTGFESAAPTAAGLFAVLQEPARIDGFANAVMSGETWALVNVSNAAHTFAKPINGDYDKLQSQAAAGPARIVWKEDGTGTKWAYILIDPNHNATGGVGADGTITTAAGTATGPDYTFEFETGVYGVDVTDYGFSATGTTVTLGIPYASTTTSGLVSTSGQYWLGEKIVVAANPQKSTALGGDYTSISSSVYTTITETVQNYYYRAVVNSLLLQPGGNSIDQSTSTLEVWVNPSYHTFSIKTADTYNTGADPVLPAYTITYYAGVGVLTEKVGLWSTVSGLQFSGGLYTGGSLDVDNLAYTPATSSNWGPSPPSTVVDAIDAVSVIMNAYVPTIGQKSFTVPGTYDRIISTDGNYQIKCYGGGGGGGGGSAGTGGDGGGGGEYASETVALRVGDVITIVVGDGGAGGTAGNSGVGGTQSSVASRSGSSFTTITANGGSGGAPAGAGTGGQGGTGSTNTTHTDGGNGATGNGTNGGTGGASGLQSGAAGGTGSNTGSAGTSGAGGGGGGPTNGVGGAGGNGVVIVEKV